LKPAPIDKIPGGGDLLSEDAGAATMLAGYEHSGCGVCSVDFDTSQQKTSGIAAQLEGSSQ
jgi:hypothetical protein